MTTRELERRERRAYNRLRRWSRLHNKGDEWPTWREALAMACEHRSGKVIRVYATVRGPAKMRAASKAADAARIAELRATVAW